MSFYSMRTQTNLLVRCILPRVPEAFLVRFPASPFVASSFGRRQSASGGSRILVECKKKTSGNKGFICNFAISL